jgi:hypothetical protein
MKRFIHIALIALVTACGSPAERAAEDALRKGEQPYRQGQYHAADSIYAQAAFDPRVAYDLGNALYEQDLLDTAIRSYSAAIEGTFNEDLKAAGSYNLGNGWALLAHDADSLSDLSEKLLSEMRIEGNDLGQKVRQFVVRDSLQQGVVRLEHMVDSALAQSADAYKNNLRRTPADEDARHNLAVVQKLIAQRVKEAAERKKNKDQDKNKGLSERAKLLMKKADELVEQFKFTDALKVLQDGLKTEPTLQQQQEYMHKLDVVTQAAQAK